MNIVLSAWLLSRQSLDLLTGFWSGVQGMGCRGGCSHFIHWRWALFTLAATWGGLSQTYVHFYELKTFDIVVLRFHFRWHLNTFSLITKIIYAHSLNGASLMAQLVKNLNTWVLSLGWEDPIFWPGEFHGLYSLWGRQELDTTEWLSLTHSLNIPTLSKWIN